MKARRGPSTPLPLSLPSLLPFPLLRAATQGETGGDSVLHKYIILLLFMFYKSLESNKEIIVFQGN